MRVEKKEGEGAARKPIRGTFPRCCASAKETVAKKKVASSQTINLEFIVLALFFADN
jgi:hypothetical protein